MSAPTGPLRELLEHVLEGEPSVGEEVDAVFRRADRLRRRRTQLLLGSGLLGAAAIVAAGYLLTTTLLPGRPAVTVTPVVSIPASVAPAPAVTVTSDAVRDLVEPLIEGRGLDVKSVERGDGWRRYHVVDGDQPRGAVDVAVYDKSDDYCFPVKADKKACARVDQAGGLEFVRYDDVADENWQVRQTIARRASDGRTVAVMATGKRDVGAEKGKPALTGAQVEQVATDDRVFDAFGPETCEQGCPPFRTPVG
ncbi:hypothetical protein AB0J83_39925 [Actinoplanes sp. NPDC049596]|uniref:hypothetical protein n=1 Tax=unclassified Actinoplanes TaxID=2626549 RepID=UPI0034377450